MNLINILNILKRFFILFLIVSAIFAAETIEVTAAGATPGTPAASDIADNGDARDIQVTFNGADDETTITGYRIFVVASTGASSFDAAAASSNANYVTEVKTGNGLPHNVILTQTLLDSSGIKIVNGTPYQIFVYAAGANTLSGGSNYLTLISSAPSPVPYINSITNADTYNLTNTRTIAGDSLGNYYVTYHGLYNGYTHIFVRKSEDNGVTWKYWNGSSFGFSGPEVPVESSGNYNQRYSSLAIDSSNNVHVVWQGTSGASTTYEQIRYSKYSGGSWSPPINLTSGSRNQAGQGIVVDSSDNLHVIWFGGVSSSIYQIRYVKYSGGSWSSITNLTSSSYYQANPYIAVDASNNLHVVWHGGVTSSTYQIRYREYSGSSWSPITNLTSDSYSQNVPSIAVDSGNNLHVVWSGPSSASPSYNQIRYAKYSGGSWTSPIDLTSDSNTQYVLSIAVDSNNNVHIIWYGGVTSTIFQVKHIEYTGFWSDITNITSGNYNMLWASLELHGRGFVWQGTTDKNGISSSDKGLMFGLEMPPLKPGTSGISDIADNGDGRDMQVTFNGAGDETNITEYRIYVVPTSSRDSFDSLTASGLPASSYIIEPKTGNNNPHTVVLSQSLLDTKGTKIVNGRPYNVFVLSIGPDGFINNLSVPSNNLTLSTAGNYSYIETSQADFNAGTLTNAISQPGGYVELSTGSSVQTEDFEDTTYAFTFSGDWVRVNTTPHSGLWCFRNKDITDWETSTTQSTLTLGTAGILSFWYRTSTENNFDYFYFYMDDILMIANSGDNNWTQVSYPVSAGTHTLKWVYSKDPGASSGEDSVYIDDISISDYNLSGTYISPVIDISPAGRAGSSQISWDCDLNGEPSLTLETNLSLDGGSTWLGWQTAVNAEAIQGIALSTNLSNARLRYKADLSIVNGSITPLLHDVVINMTPALYCQAPEGPSALDTANNGDGRDILAAFNGAGDETNISGYRIFVVPSVQAGSFNVDAASALTAERYVDEAKNGDGGLHAVTLTQAFQDSTGAAIVNGTAYNTFVLSVGQNGYYNSLSAGSSDLILSPDVPDTTGPSGCISINSDSAVTTSETVSLSIYASDLGAATEMIIANATDFSGEAWEPYTTSRIWTLAGGDGIKTVYIKFKDTVGNESTAYSDTIILDTMEPTGTIAINNDDLCTENQTVTLSIYADRLESVEISVYESIYGSLNTEITYMMISNNASFSLANWEAYNTTKQWTLSNGDGNKTVYIRFMDSLSSISETYSDSIIFDTAVPVGSITINNGAERTDRTSVTLGVYGYDANGIGQMMISNYPDFNGAGWETYNTIKSWDLTGGNSVKTVYIKFRDILGKESPVYSDAIMLDVPPPPDTVGPKAPQANTCGGVYNKAVSITLVPAYDAVSTFYTLDGGEPDKSSLSYEGDITVDGEDGTNVTLKAVSYDSAGNKGDTVIEIYTFDKTGPDEPKANPGGGKYTKAVSVTIIPADNAVPIYYTLDGSTPDSTKAVYNGPITIDGEDKEVITLKAVSYDTLGNKGAVMSQTYIFEKQAAPLIQQEKTQQNETSVPEAKQPPEEETPMPEARQPEITGGFGGSGINVQSNEIIQQKSIQNKNYITHTGNIHTRSESVPNPEPIIIEQNNDITRESISVEKKNEKVQIKSGMVAVAIAGAAVVAGAAAIGTGVVGSAVGAGAAGTAIGAGVAGSAVGAGIAGSAVGAGVVGSAAGAGAAAAGTVGTAGSLGGWVYHIISIFRQIILFPRRVLRMRQLVYTNYRRARKLKRGIKLDGIKDIASIDIKKMKKMGITFAEIRIELEDNLQSIIDTEFKNVQETISRLLKDGMAAAVKIDMDESIVKKLAEDVLFANKTAVICEKLAKAISKYSSNKVFIEIPYGSGIDERYIRAVRRGSPKQTIILSGVETNTLLELKKPQVRNIVFSFIPKVDEIQNLIKSKAEIKRAYKWSKKKKIPLIASIENVNDIGCVVGLKRILDQYSIGWIVNRGFDLKDIRLLKALKLKKLK